MEIFANDILKQDKIKFREITPKTAQANDFSGSNQRRSTWKN
jgi:type I restriction enzyme M protein